MERGRSASGMASRRTILGAAAVGITGSVAGCMGGFEENHEDDDGDGDDESERTGDGTADDAGQDDTTQTNEQGWMDPIYPNDFDKWPWDTETFKLARMRFNESGENLISAYSPVKIFDDLTGYEITGGASHGPPDEGGAWVTVEDADEELEDLISNAEREDGYISYVEQDDQHIIYEHDGERDFGPFKEYWENPEQGEPLRAEGIEDERLRKEVKAALTLSGGRKYPSVVEALEAKGGSLESVDEFYIAGRGVDVPAGGTFDYDEMNEERDN